MKTALKTTALVAGSMGLLAGLAGAQTSPVVGFETGGMAVGFNFAGIRLHQNPVASGQLETVNANSVVDADIDLGAIMDGSTFILEIENADGVIQEVTASDGGTGLATADTSGITAPVAYTLRPADTIASVFGAANESGLAPGNFGAAGADVIWLWNGSGFDQYYYDNFAPPTFAAPGWTDLVNGTAADPTTIDLVYADSFVINSSSGNDVVVSGDLKAGPTELSMVAGFNFVGSVGPVGMTVAVAFGPNNESGLAPGNFGAAGADVIWIWNGTGFDQYYYDNFAPPTFAAPGWTDLVNGTAADPTTIALPSGYVINSGAGGRVTQGVPSYYAGL